MPRCLRLLTLWLVLTALLCAALGVTMAQAQPLPVPYPIVAVKAPRHGDTTPTRWAEVRFPIMGESDTDLVILWPDGTEEVLVPGGDGMIVDPVLSFQADWVYYVKFPDMRQLNKEFAAGKGVPILGSDIFKMHITTRQIVQLTFGEWTPNTGVGQWSTDPVRADPSPNPRQPTTNAIGHRPFSLGPCPLPGGKLMFTSSRNGLLPPKTGTYPTLQLFVLDETTGIVELVGHLTIGSALHPTVLTSGEVMFSSYEAQGLRDPRVWGLWALYPDGRRWRPLMSAFVPAKSLHFQTQLSDGRVAVVEYYNLNNNGFGTLLAFSPGLEGRPMADNVAPFGHPNPKHPSNPFVPYGYEGDGSQRTRQYSFSPPGITNLTAFAHGSDEASDKINDFYMGKVTHPSAAPCPDGSRECTLLVWSGGPANDLNRPTDVPRVQGEIRLLVGNTPVYTPSDLVVIKSDPRYNYQQPRAVVPYKAIYGIGEPATLPWLPNDGTISPHLPAGTPYGLVGTSSHMKRNTAPGVLPRGRDEGSNWRTQGADDMNYTDDEIDAVLIVQMEGHTHRPRGPNGARSQSDFCRNPANEHLRILGEVPLRKWNSEGQPVMDKDGNADTSWLAKIPADVPFTFVTIDKEGRTLNWSQTWHQVRPGEVRNDCGGCHAHAQVGTPFEGTYASRKDYAVHDLTKSPPRDIEYHRDIKPVLQRVNPALALLTPEVLLAQYVRPFRPRLSSLGIQLPGLTPDETRTVNLWMTLGAPVSKHETHGWSLDELRPTLSLTLTRQPITCPAGCVAEATETLLLVGAYDAHLDTTSLQVSLDGADVTPQLTPMEGSRWQLPLTGGGLVVARIRDVQANWTERRLVVMP